MDVNSSAAMRKRATDWLNSKIRDLDTGIKILEDAGYKPAVMENFRSHINRRDIPLKLLQEIRNYLRYHATQDAEIHRDIIIPPESYENIKKVGQEVSDEYPQDIKNIISELSSVFKQRGIFHNKLSETGEGNTSDQKTERVKLLAIVKACSDRITVLSEAYNKFTADGTMPDKEILQNVFDPEKVVFEQPVPEPEDTNEFKTADTLEDLKKQQDNWRIKIYKTENKLLYQSEKKQQEQNPMPEGPKRIKQEKRIAQLKREKNIIDLAIVNWK